MFPPENSAKKRLSLWCPLKIVQKGLSFWFPLKTIHNGTPEKRKHLNEKGVRKFLAAWAFFEWLGFGRDRRV